MTPTHHTCSYCGFMWEPGEPGRHSCAFYLKAAVERLKQELAQIGAQAPVGVVQVEKTGSDTCYVGILYASAIVTDKLEHGTQLYAKPAVVTDQERAA